MTGGPLPCGRPYKGGRPQAIYVFGCARSGTTLLQTLLRRFAETRVVPRETWLHEAPRSPGGFLVVTKRVGSRDLRKPQSAHRLEYDALRQPTTAIVDIVRDPRDVITSVYPGDDGFYAGFERWERDTSVIDRVSALTGTVIRVRFEDLVSRPDAVQDQLGNLMELTPTEPFSAYPGPSDYSAVPAKSVEALGALRPISATVIGRWRCDPSAQRRVARQVARHPELVERLRRYGYEADDHWLDDMEVHAP